jgi:hypothetical protein
VISFHKWGSKTGYYVANNDLIAGRQACRQACRQAGRQAGRQQATLTLIDINESGEQKN